MSEALDLIAREGWVFWPSALALFLAIGSFLNVVIHRVPGQLEWSWQAPNARGAKPPGVIWPGDRKSTRLNSSHVRTSRMPSSA